MLSSRPKKVTYLEKQSVTYCHRIMVSRVYIYIYIYIFVVLILIPCDYSRPFPPIPTLPTKLTSNCHTLSNTGIIKLNASAIGMAAAALEAMDQLNLFGTTRDQLSVTHVMLMRSTSARRSITQCSPGNPCLRRWIPLSWPFLGIRPLLSRKGNWLKLPWRGYLTSWWGGMVASTSNGMATRPCERTNCDSTMSL